MQMNIDINFHNKFTIRTIRDGEIIQEGYAENIVLNNSFSKVCNFLPYFTAIQFGSGTGDLDPTRTSLFAPLGAKTATTVETIKANPISKVTKRIELLPNEYINQYIREVGISDSTNTSGTLNTHALVKDSEGNPISIYKTNIDKIEIYATVYIELISSFSHIKFTSAVSNSLIDYFLNNTTPYNNIIVNGYSGKDYRSTNGGFVTTKLSNVEINVTNRTRVYSSRFDFNEANHEIARVGIKDIFVGDLLETRIFEGKRIINKKIQDAHSIPENKRYIIPNRLPSNIEITQNGSPQTLNVDYNIESYPLFVDTPLTTNLYFEFNKGKFSPDGENLIVVEQYNDFYFYKYNSSIDNYELTSSPSVLPYGYASCMTWTKNSQYLLLGTKYDQYDSYEGSGDIILYKKVNGQYQFIWKETVPFLVENLLFLPNSNYFLCLGVNNFGDYFAYLFKKDTNDIVSFVDEPNISISSSFGMFIPNTNYLIVDGSWYRFDESTESFIKMTTPETIPNGLKPSPSGTFLANKDEVWKLNGNILEKVQNLNYGELNKNGVDWSLDGSILFGYSGYMNDNVDLWMYINDNGVFKKIIIDSYLKQNLDISSQINSIEFSSKNICFISISNSRQSGVKSKICKIYPDGYKLIKFINPIGAIKNKVIGIGNGNNLFFPIPDQFIPSSIVVKIDNNIINSGFTINTNGITFSTAPTSGTVIKVDYAIEQDVRASYDTPVIPKNENYVLDVTCVLQFGGDIRL